MKLRKLVLLTLILGLVACSSEREKKEAYFEKHPATVQPAAMDCAHRVMNGEHISKNPTCQAVVAFEKKQCEIKHREGALYYLDYDCNDNVQMLHLAMGGF